MFLQLPVFSAWAEGLMGHDFTDEGAGQWVIFQSGHLSCSLRHIYLLGKWKGFLFGVKNKEWSWGGGLVLEVFGRQA